MMRERSSIPNVFAVLATAICAVLPVSLFPACVASVGSSATKPSAPVLTGRTLDGRGAPIQGVRVTLWSGIGTLFRQGETETDETGRYRFEVEHAVFSVDPETKAKTALLWIDLEHPTFASADGENRWHLQLPLGNGTVVTRDFKMVEGGSLHGRLVDASTGQPIRQSLRIYSGWQDKTRYLRYADTDSDGRFELNGLFPDDYTIDVNGVDGRYPILGQVRVDAGGHSSIGLRWQPGPIQRVTLDRAFWLGSAERPANVVISGIDMASDRNHVMLGAWTRDLTLEDARLQTFWDAAPKTFSLELDAGESIPASAVRGSWWGTGEGRPYLDFMLEIDPKARSRMVAKARYSVRAPADCEAPCFRTNENLGIVVPD